MKKCFVLLTLILCLSFGIIGCGSADLEATHTPTSTNTPTTPPTTQPTPTNTIPPQPSFSSYPVALIYDDDGSPDGTLANFYLLANPDVDLKVISISYGEATPERYIHYIGGLLEEFDIDGILLGAGVNEPLEGDNAFPSWITEAADAFWYQPIPGSQGFYSFEPAVDVIIDTIKNAPQPITLYFAGAYTTLAQALRDDPTIASNIQAVYLMGGAVYDPGNIHDFYPDDPNVYAEWNLYADPVAAQEVFESGLDLYLIPLDATNRVFVSSQDTRAWREGGKIANRAADLWDSIMSTWTQPEGSMWDTTAAIAMMHPEFCPFIPMHLEVITEEGPRQGQTAIVPGAAPNIAACLEPDSAAIRQHLIDIFQNSP